MPGARIAVWREQPSAAARLGAVDAISVRRLAVLRTRGAFGTCAWATTTGSSVKKVFAGTAAFVLRARFGRQWCVTTLERARLPAGSRFSRSCRAR